MYIDNLLRNLQQLEDDLTLKKDYTEEIEIIKGIKGDIKTLSGHHWNTPKYKIQDANEKANKIIEWMQEEMKQHNSITA